MKESCRGNNWYVWKIKDGDGNSRFSVTYEFQRELVEGSLSKNEEIVGYKTLSEALQGETNIYALGIHSQESNKFKNPHDES